MDCPKAQLSKELNTYYVQLSQLNARNNPADFVFMHCKTLDSHDKKNPIKEIVRKPHLEEIIDFYLNTEVGFLEKSRQMLVTWICGCCDLWDAMYHAGRQIFIQSKKLEDADKLLDRIWFTYQYLEEHLKVPAQRKEGYIIFHSINSEIKAVAQGGDQIRQYTPSRVRSEELAFQEASEDSYASALPAIQGGGQYIAISSPNFKDFFFRTVTQIKAKQMDGKVYTLHFSADEEATKKAESARLRMSKWKWEQEYNLNYNIPSGDRVYEDFDPIKHVAKLDVMPKVTMIRSWDFGYRRPNCLLAQMLNDKLYVLFNIMGNNEHIWTFRDRVMEFCQALEVENKTVFDYEDYCDIAGTYNSDTSELTSVEVLNQAGIYPQYSFLGRNNSVNLVRKLLAKDLLIVNESESDVIDMFMGGLHYPEIDLLKQRPKVIIPYRDGFYEHIADCLQYMVGNKVSVWDMQPEKEKSMPEQVDIELRKWILFKKGKIPMRHDGYQLCGRYA